MNGGSARSESSREPTFIYEGAGDAKAPCSDELRKTYPIASRQRASLSECMEIPLMLFPHRHVRSALFIEAPFYASAVAILLIREWEKSYSVENNNHLPSPHSQPGVSRGQLTMGSHRLMTTLCR